MNISELTLNELTNLATRDFEERRLSAEVRTGLLDMRLSGLSTLQQWLKEPLIIATEEDVKWYQKEQKKGGAYDRQIAKQLVTDAPLRRGTLDTTDIDDYLKECSLQERETLKDYIKDHTDFLRTRYPLPVSEWFTVWYAFWADQTDIYKVQLDWDIYFSILREPKPPQDFLLRFNEIIIKWNTVERNRLRPKYLIRCWNDEEIRNKVLRGEMFSYNHMICPYSTIFSYIHRRKERQLDKILATHKEAKKAIDRASQRRCNGRDKLLRQVSRLNTEGHDIVLVNHNGKTVGFYPFIHPFFSGNDTPQDALTEARQKFLSCIDFKPPSQSGRTPKLEELTP